MAARPDGGWGWIIAIAMFFTCVILDGVKYSFGIMFAELVATFQKSKSETSWIMSIQVGTMLLSGPIVAVFVNIFGCRTTALVGTVLCFAGFLSSSFVQSIYVMYITFGFLAGFGFGMMALPGKVLLARYFDKRLAFASGIAAMGSGFGTLVFNPLSKVLIDMYTWRGTLLLEAGIVLNGILCALVMIPPKQSSENMYVNKESIKDDKEMQSLAGIDTNSDTLNHYSVDVQGIGNKASSIISQPFNRAINSCIDTEDQIKNSLSSHENTHIESVNDGDFDVTVPLFTTTKENMNDATDRQFSISDTYYESRCTMTNDQTTLSPKPDGKICKNNSPEFFNRTDNLRMLKAGNKEVAAAVTINKKDVFTHDTDNTKAEKNENSETKSRRWLSLAPLKNPAFLCFLLSGILVEMSLTVPFTFLPEMMIRKGFKKQDAVWMLFIIGLVSTVSRFVIGFIADLRFVNRVKLCNSILVINGIFVMLCPFCANYASFVAFSVLFGTTVGSGNSLRGILVPDLFGVEMIADLYGINSFFCAFAAFVGLPKAGALLDATDNYTVPFLVAGAELTVSGLILFLIPVVQRCNKVPLPTK